MLPLAPSALGAAFRRKIKLLVWRDLKTASKFGEASAFMSTWQECDEDVVCCFGPSLGLFSQIYFVYLSSSGISLEQSVMTWSSEIFVSG